MTDELKQIIFSYSRGNSPLLKPREIQLLVKEGYKVKSRADETLKMAWKAAKNTNQQKLFHSELSKVKQHYLKHGVKVNSIIGNKSLNQKELKKLQKQQKKIDIYLQKQNEREKKSNLKALKNGFVLVRNMKTGKRKRKRLTPLDIQKIQKRLKSMS